MLEVLHFEIVRKFSPFLNPQSVKECPKNIMLELNFHHKQCNSRPRKLSNRNRRRPRLTVSVMKQATLAQITEIINMSERVVQQNLVLNGYDGYNRKNTYSVVFANNMPFATFQLGL
ncbi:hypothetical protein TNCV_790921 [Trichonephila clavipes]|nr:hypothetical protein TNCV_790921 [Trichonephila clavipes]